MCGGWTDCRQNNEPTPSGRRSPRDRQPVRPHAPDAAEDDDQTKHDRSKDHAGKQPPLNAVLDGVEDNERQQKREHEEQQRPKERMPKSHLD